MNRTASLVAGLVLVASLVVLQVIRLVEEPDRNSAIVQGVAGFLALGLILAGALFIPRLVYRNRWRSAIAGAPGPALELLAIGDYRDDSDGVLHQVAVYIGEGSLLLAERTAMEVLPVLKEVSFNELVSADVEQADTQTNWATNLVVGVRDKLSVSVTLDGWRWRRRRTLFDIAYDAAEAINAKRSDPRD